MNKKVILIVIAIIGLVGGITAYMYYNKPHRDVASEKSDFTMESSALFSEFENKEAESNTKYLNKVISVSGKVGEILKSDSTLNIILRQEDDFFGVNCSLLPNAIEKGKSLKVGDAVKIKGACDGYIDDVVLTKCSFEK